MDLEETEARSNCAGEGQQQFNRPTDSTVILGCESPHSSVSRLLGRQEGQTRFMSLLESPTLWRRNQMLLSDFFKLLYCTSAMRYKPMNCEGSQSRQRVNHDHEFRGTRNQYSLCWRGPPAIQQSANQSVSQSVSQSVERVLWNVASAP
jgi:hypothetical protein